MSEIEHGSTNLYADLGMAAPEEMLIKAQLVTKIAEIVKRRKLTPAILNSDVIYSIHSICYETSYNYCIFITR